MISFAFHKVPLTKRYPLRISRGVTTSTINLFVTACDDIHTGVGEAACAETAESQLRSFLQDHYQGQDVHELWQLAWDHKVAPCAWACVDAALWDLKAKQAGMPLSCYCM